MAPPSIRDISISMFKDIYDACVILLEVEYSTSIIISTLRLD